MFIVVPDSLRDEINRRIDAALAELSGEDRDVAENDREFLFGQLVDAFDKHGMIPDFSLVPNLPEFKIVRS